MNQGVVYSSSVQQMVAAASPYWWSINNMRPPSSHHQHHSFLAAPSHNYFPPHQLIASASWHDSQEQPESWSQLLLGGSVGEADKPGLSHKRVENWEQQVVNQTSNSCVVADVNKQENSANSYTYCPEGYNAKPTICWSQSHQMVPASSPKSCVTTLSSNLLDCTHNHKKSSDPQLPEPDPSSECNSKATGGVAKKARIQPSSAQSTFKVRKEKLGDRITALHQLVSPFGKTDTASVLLEAIGYIRFLQSQVEALSLPYLQSRESRNNVNQQHPVQGKRNCLFPEIPEGQESEEGEEEKKDLKSRGLCLIPISSTLHFGSDNGADYWAPAFGEN